jgi:hypothetical protein
LGGGSHAQQLDCTLGDVISITETQTGHTAQRYYIIGEAHQLSESAQLWQTTWYLAPAASEPFPWKLGVTDRGELGVNTRLAF